MFRVFGVLGVLGVLGDLLVNTSILFHIETIIYALLKLLDVSLLPLLTVLELLVLFELLKLFDLLELLLLTELLALSHQLLMLSLLFDLLDGSIVDFVP
jgi:hypothetical protein